MPVPYMQFQKHNPMDLAIQTALKTYGGITQGQNTQLQNEKMRKELPYYEEMLRNKNMLDALNAEKMQASQPYLKEMAEYDSFMRGLDRAMKPAERELAYKTKNEQLPYIASKSQSDINYKNTMAENIQEMIANPALRHGGSPYEAWYWTQGPGATGAAPGAQPGNQMPNQIPNQAPNQGPGQMPPPGTTAPTQLAPGSNPSVNPNMYAPPAATAPATDFERIRQAKVEDLAKTPAQRAGEAQSARNDQNLYSSTMKGLGESAQAASIQNQSMDVALDAYARMPGYSKGAILGMIAPFESTTNLFESLEAGLTVDELSKITGAASDKDLANIQKIFGGRKLDDEDKLELFTIKKIANNRMIEKQGFYADRKGQDPGQIEKEWNQRMQSESMFDDPSYKQFREIRKIKHMTVAQRKNYRETLEKQAGRSSNE